MNQPTTFRVASPARESDGTALVDARVTCWPDSGCWVCECRGLGISKKFAGDAESAARAWLRECGFENVAIVEAR